MLKLIRVSTGDAGTFGVLLKDGVPLCVTLELPWEDNQRNISCIPEGWYQIQKTDSPCFGETFEVRDVPGRSHIIFHVGNTVEDSRGCILLGQRYGYHLNRRGVWDSSVTVERFLKQMTAPIDALRIVNAYCSPIQG